MIEVKEKTLELVKVEDIFPELGDYLKTYVQQYNQMVETYEWMKAKLNTTQRLEWEKSIKALKDVCLALDAGFSPTTPPRNWASGQLIQYMAPIPQHVREAIDKAEPIFGRSRILVYDPNVEHFQRPKKLDPLAIGFVDLAEQRLHFLIGQWDLASDLKFIEGQKLNEMPIERASQNVRQTIDILLPQLPSSTFPWPSKQTHPVYTTPKWGTGAGKWVSFMTCATATKQWRS